MVKTLVLDTAELGSLHDRSSYIKTSFVVLSLSEGGMLLKAA